MYKLLICLLLTVFIPCLSYAETITVAGAVSGDWDADSVVVLDDIEVPPEQTLTIQPGVEVLFRGNYEFVVDTNATLIAIGTESDPILFDQYEPGIHFKGIRLWYSALRTELSHCILKRGYAVGSGNSDTGGGILCYHTNPTISYCTIDSCSAADDGGAIAIENASPTISNCNFFNNSTNDDGGAIVVFSNSYPVIHFNVFINNRANDLGGAICNYSGSISLVGNTIQNNTAGAGGGLYLNNGSHIISQNVISGNLSLYGYGGGVFDANTESEFSYNQILNNMSDDGGGGLYSESCETSHYFGNLIMGNQTNGTGGGVRITTAPLTFKNNIIRDNQANNNGGGMYCNNSNYTLIENHFINNTVTSVFEYGGGGLYLYNSGNELINNYFYGNYGFKGGGIFCDNLEDAVVTGNEFINNEGYYGGGMYIEDTEEFWMSDNTFSQNEASYGGGIYFNYFTASSGNTTIVGNSAERGGGIYTIDSSPRLVNTIMWNNSDNIYQVYSPEFSMNYSDVQGGWWGEMNIDEDPLFVNETQNDYRLLWDSPCIDAGHISPRLTDPDSTNSDIGAGYFDQSHSFHVRGIPHDQPITIPGVGGSFTYDILATNITADTLEGAIWCSLILPNGASYGTVMGPEVWDVPGGESLTGEYILTVPPTAGFGLYHLYVLAACAGDTIRDYFLFEKIDGTADYSQLNGWSNRSTGSAISKHSSKSSNVPEQFALKQNYPNPFNPTTTIEFTLPEASYVTLTVFDVSGRMVSGTSSMALISGYRTAGTHEVTFDGSGLASGIYIYQLEAGPYKASGKMVLMK